MAQYFGLISRSLLLSLCVGSVGSAEDRKLNYFMTVEGTCSKLELNGEVLRCKDILGHTEYDDGRIGFYFIEDGADGINLTFSGSGIGQSTPSVNVRVQPIDGVIQIDGILDVSGECMFENPYVGPANIKCEALAVSGERFVGHFLTNGSKPKIMDLP